MTLAVPYATFTRPNNVTAYAAGQNVFATAAGVMTFDISGLRRDPAVKLSGATVKKSNPVVTLATFRLHLFRNTKGNFSDQQALTFATLTDYIGNIVCDLATLSYSGTADSFKNTVIAPSSVDFARNHTAGSIQNDIVFGYLEATAAYVPTANEVFEIQPWFEAW